MTKQKDGLMHVPRVLTEHLVEVALDQPQPTAELQAVLQHVLREGKHPDRLRL